MHVRLFLVAAFTAAVSWGSATPSPPLRKIDISVLSDKIVCGLEASKKTYDRIKGGSRTGLEESPWMARLEYVVKGTTDSKGLRCGGTLIHRRFVLTAAHCLENEDFEISRVWLGVLNATGADSDINCVQLNNTKIICIHSLQIHNILERIPHPRYDSNHKRNDIALLLLDNDIEFTKYIRPICLPSLYAAESEDGTLLTVTGWGSTGDTDKPSDIKLKVKVPVRPIRECNQILQGLGLAINGSSQICAGGEEGKDTCQGDSGGPLMRIFNNTEGENQWYQEGIVSFGVDCGLEGYPAVYTRVASYVSWIEKQISSKYKQNSPDVPSRPFLIG